MYFFYPIGNTLVVNLLRDIYLEDREDVNILSIAYSDVRNVLFTLLDGTTIESRTTINFTLYNYKPAVLTRNIFLFTFLLDNYSSNNLKSL